MFPRTKSKIALQFYVVTSLVKWRPKYEKNIRNKISSVFDSLFNIHLDTCLWRDCDALRATKSSRNDRGRYAASIDSTRQSNESRHNHSPYPCTDKYIHSRFITCADDTATSRDTNPLPDWSNLWNCRGNNTGKPKPCLLSESSPGPANDCDG